MTRSQQKDRIRTAYHEAGHAVIAYFCGFIPYRATIKAGINETGPFLKEVRIKVPELDFILAPRLAAFMLYELAGIAAENRYSRRRLDNFERIGGYNDLRSFEKHWLELLTQIDGACPDDG